MLLWNTGICLPFDTVKHSRRLLFISTAVRMYTAIKPTKLVPVHTMKAAILLFYILQRYYFESYTFFQSLLPTFQDVKVCGTSFTPASQVHTSGICLWFVENELIALKQLKWIHNMVISKVYFFLFFRKEYNQKLFYVLRYWRLCF